MREIKFRAWDKKNNHYLNPYNISFEMNAILTDSDAMYSLEDEVVLEQFTGLHDKNGKEVYEGDIVQITITFNAYAPMKGAALWTTRKEIHPVKVRPGITTAGNLILYNYKSDEVQVIGNIHENKELLDGGNDKD